MKLRIKNPKENTEKDIEIPESATIQQLAETAAPLFNADSNTIKFIYQAKILNPNAHLSDCKITDGCAVMINFKKAPQPIIAQQSADIIVEKPVDPLYQQENITTEQSGEYFPKDYIAGLKKPFKPSLKPQPFQVHQQQLQQQKIAQPAPTQPHQPLRPNAQPATQPNQLPNPRQFSIGKHTPVAVIHQLTMSPQLDIFSHQILKDPQRCKALLSNAVIQNILQQICGDDPIVVSQLQNSDTAFNLIKQSQQVFRKNGTQSGEGCLRGVYGFMDDNDEDVRAKTNAELMQQIAQQSGRQPAASVPAPRSADNLPSVAELRTKWQNQMLQIQAMGIEVDEQEILRMLELYNGDVEMVINMLLAM